MCYFISFWQPCVCVHILLSFSSSTQGCWISGSLIAWKHFLCPQQLQKREGSIDRMWRVIPLHFISFWQPSCRSRAIVVSIFKTGLLNICIIHRLSDNTFYLPRNLEKEREAWIECDVSFHFDSRMFILGMGRTSTGIQPPRFSSKLTLFRRYRWVDHRSLTVSLTGILN